MTFALLLLYGCSGDSDPTEGDADTDTDSDTDSDTDTDTDIPAVVEAFTVCGTQAFPDVPARIHTCPQPCTGDLDACSWDSTAETGWPSRSLNFVAEGRGGVLRYATQEGPTLLVHNGGTGTEFPPRTVSDGLVAAGGRAVELAWYGASATGTNCEDDDCGWLTRPLETVPSDIEEASARPAAVIRWAHDTLSGGSTYGTLACSAGSLATFYARYFDDLDPLLDYQMFIGGPLIYSAEWGCSGRPTGCSGTECGRCRTDPSIVCDVDGPVGQCLGAGGSCASYRLTGTLGLLEVLYLNQATCPLVTGTDYAGADLATATGDLQVEHPVDFVLNTNPLPQLGDDDIGVSPNAWEVYQALSGPDIGFTMEMGAHCAAFSTTATCEQVLTRMGLDNASVHCAP